MVLNGKTDPMEAFITELDTPTYKDIPYLNLIDAKKGSVETKINRAKAQKPNWLK